MYFLGGGAWHLTLARTGSPWRFTSTKAGKCSRSARSPASFPSLVVGRVCQIHVITTVHELLSGEWIYRMRNRWQQKDQSRYVLMHFALKSHDS